ncbi:MAG: hypothetical protein K6G47_11150 [Clostridia bacterium]|nr:hypothetical protein [Clostridia bacterium]
MKKLRLFVIPVLCAFMISSCSALFEPNTTWPSGEEYKSVYETEETEEETEETMDNKDYSYGAFPEAPWKIKDTLIYDQDNISITAKELMTYNGKASYYALALWVENNSTHNITLTMTQMFVNDIEYRLELPEQLYIPANTKETYYGLVNLDDLSTLNITDIGTIDVKFEALNDNEAVQFETDLVTIKTNFFGETETPSLIGGTVVADSELLVASIKIVETEEANFLEVFAMNNSDKNMRVITPTLSFGDGNLDTGIRFDILPHKGITLLYDLNNPLILQSNNYVFPDSVDISFAYRLSKTSDYDWVSPTGHLDVTVEQKPMLDIYGDAFGEEEE